MILDYRNEQNNGVYNKVDGFIKGTALIIYGHVQQQFIKRIDPVRNIIDHDLFDYDNLITEVKNVITMKYNDLIEIPKKRVITFDIPVKCRNRDYAIELAVIVQSSYPKFSALNKKKQVLPEYLAYYNSRQISTQKLVIAIETIVYSIKVKSELNNSFKATERLLIAIPINDTVIRMHKQQMEEIIKTIPREKRYQRFSSAAQLQMKNDGIYVY